MSKKWRSEVPVGIALCFVGAALTFLPYFLAQEMTAPEEVFSGFLLNPQDGFSYLAKMRQGAGGSWLFTLPYAQDPGTGTFLFTYYLLLGHIANWLSLPLLTVLHIARGIGAVLMYCTAYLLIRRFTGNSVQHWSALGFVLVGSGLGWLGVPAGILASDLLIPESIPFLSAFTNAHFALASALLVCMVLLLQWEDAIWRRTSLSAAAGFLLAVIQPFAIFCYTGIAGVWLILEMRLKRREERLPFLKDKVWPFGAALAAAAPFGFYDFWVSRFHPVISAWNAQNLTPSPPIYEFLLGLGLPLVFSLIAIGWGRVHKTSNGRLLITWILVQILMMYLPFNLQRRVSLGIYFPFAILAVWGMAHVARNGKWLPFLAGLTLLLSIPSNLIVVASGLTSIEHEEAQLTLDTEEIAAYAWLADLDAQSPLILAGPRSGNRIPAYSEARVLYGHPFETPDAEAQEALVRSLYADEDASADLMNLGIEYVLYGPEETGLGPAVWLSNLELLWSHGAYAIYQVIP